MRRAGAREAGLLDGVRRRLTRYVVQLVGVRGLGTARARLVPRPLDETAAGTLAEVDTDVPTCWSQLLPRWEFCRHNWICAGLTPNASAG